MYELVLKNVDKIYQGGFQAVFDFNIEVEHGEFIVMVGPSGCGKSTVLRMIAGLEEITSGDMYLAGKRINDAAPADREISMVFQNYALYGHMSVYENIGFSQTIKHVDEDTIHEKVMHATDVVQLHDELNRLPKNLSGGQRQRVALGRSIVNSARVILMDEPLSNLDAKLRVESRRQLSKLHQQLGNTFVYVTHDQTEAMTMATRIVVMNRGRVQQIGTPNEVYQYPENIFVGGFIGGPPMNFIDGKIEDGRFVTSGIDIAVPEPFKMHTGDIVLGVRPEYFSTIRREGRELVRGNATHSEFLGNRSLVYLQVENQTVIANLQMDEEWEMGDASDYYIDTSKVHFFDPKTEMRIRPVGETL